MTAALAVAVVAELAIIVVLVALVLQKFDEHTDVDIATAARVLRLEERADQADYTATRVATLSDAIGDTNNAVALVADKVANAAASMATATRRLDAAAERKATEPVKTPVGMGG